jgi:hypothetical protein
MIKQIFIPISSSSTVGTGLMDFLLGTYSWSFFVTKSFLFAIASCKINLLPSYKLPEVEFFLEHLPH